jgi:LmbE family N-acetylglucosaminyl deacetylase
VKILYIYPHPDDESFGPAHVMSKQRREGHEVYLLTLTRGGATRLRRKHGYSVEEMGRVRYEEMERMAKVLDLSGMSILDFPDSGLEELDPRELEEAVRREIETVEPEVVVTFPVHGISGFHDHLVTHAIVKHVFAEMKDRKSFPRRLAFHTITEEDAEKGTLFRLSGSKPAEIDCIVTVEAADIEKSHRALDCYETFQETIEKTGIKDFIGHEAVFEIYQEDHAPPLGNLFESLP